MQPGKIAVAFSNCMGNFIIMSAAVKILRKWGYDSIDMITDNNMAEKHPSMIKLANKLFDSIVIDEYKPSNYSKVFIPRWSKPACVGHQDPVSWNGMHEIHVYLDMIGAGPEDFCGFGILDLLYGSPYAYVDIMSPYPRIALANSSPIHGSRKGALTGWDKFAELSNTLTDIGYNVILVGESGELDGCIGENFVGKCGIFETMTVLSQCDAIITVDTGLMHIADALGVPIVLLAGPTMMTKARPLMSKYKIVRKFISCAPCYQAGLWNMCEDPICMKNIQVDDVIKSLYSLDVRKPKYSECSALVDMVKLDINSRSIFRYDFNKISEIVYNPCHDMIGDLFGAVFILKWIKEKYPHVKISWYNNKINHRDGTDWFSGFNIFDFVPLQMHKLYSELPGPCQVPGEELKSDVLVISSCGGFYVWSDLAYLYNNFGWIPKIENKCQSPIDDSYVAIHILQPTNRGGDRDSAYVRRRALNFDKYEKLCHKLTADGIKIVRIGAQWDSPKIIDGIYDMTHKGLSLEESIRIVGGSKLFISGDVGLKLIASSMDVPCIVEIDDRSYKLGGMSGCDTNIVKRVKYEIHLDELYTIVKGALS